MKRHNTLVVCSTAALLALGAAGCAADATGGPVDPAAETTESSAAQSAETRDRVLATLEVGEGRTVTFREVVPGTLVVAEDGKVGQSPVLTAATGSILDVYRTLSRGAEPPEALAAAEAARIRLGSGIPETDTAPAPARITDTIVEPMTGTTLDTWFQNTYCASANSSSCVVGNNQQVVTQWNATSNIGEDSYVQNIRAYAMNNGSVTSTFGIQRWNGSAWVTLWSTSLAPQHYQGAYWWTPAKSYFLAYETSTGGDTAVDIQTFLPSFIESYYYSGSTIFVSGYQFVNDSSVRVTISSGSLSETVGTFSVSSPSVTQPGLFGGDGTISCSPYSVPGSYTATLTATGVQTGETATGSVTLTGCTL